MARGNGRQRASLRPGPQAAPALEAANWTVTGNDATHIATFSGGTLRYQSDTTTPVLTVARANALVVGLSYEITAVTSAFTSGSLKVDTIGPNVVISTALGTTTVRGVATATSLNLTRNSANVDLTLSSLAVRLLV